MSCYFHVWGISLIILDVILTIVTQELESLELGESTRSPTPFPMSLPISYQVLDADCLFLRDASQEMMQNFSMQMRSQPLVLLRASRPPAINANYGPLSAIQAVPLNLVQTTQLFRSSRGSTFGWKIQSYVLTRRIFSSMPKVRVLFYVAGREWDSGEAGAKDKLPCVTVFAFWQTQEVRGSCSLGGLRGTCMAELEPKASWFSQADESSSREKMEPAEGNGVELYYQARPSTHGGCGSEVGRWRGRVQEPRGDEDITTPMQTIGTVRLLQVPRGTASISQLKLGETIIIQMSSKPLKITDIATFYVFISSSSSVDRFTLKAVAKKGVSFSTARPGSSGLWDTSLDKAVNGTITILCQRKTTTPRKRLHSGLMEIMQLDFEAEELSGHSDSQVITWQLELPGKAKSSDQGIMRIYTTQRDFVGLAPLVMDSEILNTAVLTGKRVAVPVRTVAVEQDGSVTDVSEFTDCQTTNEDILKVSDRCDYVFVNGKEMKGKVKMAVNFTYSYLSAQLEMSVWIPRLPLQIEVSDSELSQIKGWRVPITASKRSGWDSEEEEDRKAKGCMLQFQHALVRVLTHFVADQADPREPLAYFLGEDWQVDVTELVRHLLKVRDPHIAQLQAGRVLFGRDFGVTAIQVMSPLSDSILAETTVTVLDDKVTITELGVQLVSGLSLSLQLSPGSNRVIVATATTQELLQIPKQEAAISSWIQFSDGSLTTLDIYDPSSYRLVVTSLDEEVVSVRKTPLMVVAKGEGQGVLLKAELIITASCQKTKRKSTLALGSGTLTVHFLSSGQRPSNRSNSGNNSEELEQLPTVGTVMEDMERVMPMGTATARPTIQDVAERGEVGRDGTPGRGNVGNILNVRTMAWPGLSNNGTPRKDGSFVWPGQGKDHSNLVGHTSLPTQVEVPEQEGTDADVETENDIARASRPLTDLEIGMYALLGVFCMAILVFLVNCTSFAVKFHHKRAPVPGQELHGHRHDWVWLGTDAELVMNMPSTPPLQAHPSTTIIDIGPAPENTATLSRGASCEPQTDSPVGCMGALTAKAGGSEPVHSPTSKRKRVQFTTFASLDRRRTLESVTPDEITQDIQWVGKEENCDKPEVTCVDQP